MPFSLPSSRMMLYSALAIVVQHLVVRAAQNHVGHAVGRLFDQLLGVAALHAQVDIAEQSKESRRARDHADRELGGQSKAEFVRRLSSDGDWVFLRFFLRSALRGSCPAASKTGKYCAMKRKIAKPAATIDSVIATSLHFGM